MVSQTNSRKLHKKQKTLWIKVKNKKIQFINIKEDTFLDIILYKYWAKIILSYFNTISKNREIELWSYYLKTNRFKI